MAFVLMESRPAVAKEKAAAAMLKSMVRHSMIAAAYAAIGNFVRRHFGGIAVILPG